MKADFTKMNENYCEVIESLWLPQKNIDEAECNSGQYGARYNSPADQSVEISILKVDSWLEINLYRVNQVCAEPLKSNSISGNSGIKQFSDVLFIELMRMQEYGFIVNNRDSLESFLNDQIEKMKQSSSCDDIDLITWDEYNGGSHLIGPGCCSLVEDPAQTKGKFAVAASGIRAVKVSGDRFYIQGAKIGVAFALFDMNGKLLKEGFNLTGYIQSPMTPVILKIQNQVIMLKQLF